MLLPNLQTVRGPARGQKCPLAVGVRAVSQPDGTAIGRGNNEVSIIGRGEVDEFLPVRFIGIARDEAVELLGGDAFLHAINDHRAD